MIGDTQFLRYIPDPHPDTLALPSEIRRHILCTGEIRAYPADVHHYKPHEGQVYHTLLQEREDKGIKDVAISRIEQLSPFPYDLVR
jgi:2-oxoglutarate dehydrogenase E1 component